MKMSRLSSWTATLSSSRPRSRCCECSEPSMHRASVRTRQSDPSMIQRRRKTHRQWAPRQRPDAVRLRDGGLTGSTGGQEPPSSPPRYWRRLFVPYRPQPAPRAYSQRLICLRRVVHVLDQPGNHPAKRAGQLLGRVSRHCRHLLWRRFQSAWPSSRRFSGAVAWAGKPAACGSVPSPFPRTPALESPRVPPCQS